MKFGKRMFLHAPASMHHAIMVHEEITTIVQIKSSLIILKYDRPRIYDTGHPCQPKVWK